MRIARRATGTFEVTLTPLPRDSDTPGAIISRMSLEKHYSGDLVGEAQGEMLAVRSTVNGSAGYVAMEAVDGWLHGRRGTFVLQHSGTMAHGTATLTVAVVPDSGTDELKGIAGHIEIEVLEGGHSYVFAYVIEDGQEADGAE